MSVWTSVAGIVRLDCVRVMYENDGAAIPDLIKAYFGKSFHYGDDWTQYEHEKILPCGSEGTLDLSIWTNPDVCHAASYTVSIFGDLRDVDDAEWIIEWFKQKLNKDSMLSAIPCWVRQAVIIAETDGGQRWEYNTNRSGLELVNIY